jgi:ABC-type multidrug transport system fused ATPase/permease subunit
MIDQNPTNQSVDTLKNYINLKIDVILLRISKKMSNAAAYMVFAFIMGFIALFISLFLSLSLSTWLAVVLNMPGMGNLIVSLIYIILAVIIYIFREQMILGPVKRVMTSSMDFSEMHNGSSIAKGEDIEESIIRTKQELLDSEAAIDQNIEDIKLYYSFEQMKNRFIQSIYENPKSILNTLLILREVIKSRRKK